MNYIIAIILFISTYTTSKSFDLAIMGYAQTNDGLGRLPIELATCLEDSASICFIPTRTEIKLDGTPESIKKIFYSPYQPHDVKADVLIFEDLLWYPKQVTYELPAQEKTIKLAYSMFESTQIPTEWVAILNTKFHAVLVPDPWLIKVYEDSGVIIPIFVAPISLDLKDFFQTPAKKKDSSRAFIFGNMSALETRKNHGFLIDSFARAFGDSYKVELRINARYLNKTVLQDLNERILYWNLHNVHITTDDLSVDEYRKFMSKIDCYVSFSRGEGFAIPPRQALAMAIPVILSNNTAHTNLCDSGFVLPVESHIKKPAAYGLFKKNYGYFFSCKPEAATNAMKDMYKNFDKYYRKALRGKEWVKRYTPQELKSTYLAFVKPKKIMLAGSNYVKDGVIYTTSSSLCARYTDLIERRSNLHDT